MQNFLTEAAEYILTCNEISNHSPYDKEMKPSKNLVEGAEMIKAFNG